MESTGTTIEQFLLLSDNVMPSVWYGDPAPTSLWLWHVERNFLVKHWGWFVVQSWHYTNCSRWMICIWQKGKSTVVWFGIKRTAKQKLFLVQSFQSRAAISPVVSLKLQCTLSGVMSSASCLGVTVDLIGPSGSSQVKFSQSRRSMEAILAATPGIQLMTPSV